MNSYRLSSRPLAETSQKHLEKRARQLPRQLQDDEGSLLYTSSKRLCCTVPEDEPAIETAFASSEAIHDEHQVFTEAELSRRQREIEALQDKLGETEERLAKLARGDTELWVSAWLNNKSTLGNIIVDISTSSQSMQSDRPSYEAVGKRVLRKTETLAKSWRTESTCLSTTRSRSCRRARLLRRVGSSATHLARTSQIFSAASVHGSLRPSHKITAEVEAAGQQITLLANDSRRWQENI
ncbi:hypothetical protein C8T65DRAFT_695618 [Cerioporus squamosus]|nr:hypothetical protein C8T65DRAFT_695618 [Cerioporus squamosus]